MGEFFFWPQLPKLTLPLWFYTTDPAVLVAVFSVLVAVFSTLLTYKALKWAASDDTMFPEFSRSAQAAREAAFFAEHGLPLGRSEHGTDAPHVGELLASQSFAGVGAAHDDRLPCEECHAFPALSGGIYCLHCDTLPPADRLFARGVR